MIIDFVFDFVISKPGYAILIAVLTIQFVHERITRKS